MTDSSSNNNNSSNKAEEEKEKGNRAFANKDYEAAAEHYTRALKHHHSSSNNCIYYSNRSACYHHLQQYDKAADDARACLKLNPAFIKGYYRLAAALLESHKYSESLQAVQQGIKLDSNNKQLLKQQLLIRARIEASSSAPSHSHNNHSNSNSHSIIGTAGRKEDQDEIMDLKEQYVATNRELQIVNANIQKLQLDQRRNELTKNEMQVIEDHDTRKMFRGVGKMFMLTNKTEINELLDKDIISSKKQESDLTSKKQYLEKRIKSQQDNLTELMSRGRST